MSALFIYVVQIHVEVRLAPIIKLQLWLEAIVLLYPIIPLLIAVAMEFDCPPTIILLPALVQTQLLNPPPIKE